MCVHTEIARKQPRRAFLRRLVLWTQDSRCLLFFLKDGSVFNFVPERCLNWKTGLTEHLGSPQRGGTSGAFSAQGAAGAGKQDAQPAPPNTGRAARSAGHWGGPLWRPWNPLRFWRLVLGPSMGKIFARVVIRLAAHCS